MISFPWLSARVFVVFLSGTAKVKGVQSRRASPLIGCRAMPVREGRSAVLGSELRVETASPRSAAPAHTDHKFRTASLGAWPYHLLFLVKTQRPRSGLQIAWPAWP